jgi:cell division septation protein DedD
MTSRILPAFLIGAALCSMAAVPSRADVLAGVNAWEAGDYARAIREWRPMAEAGDADAQFNLGQAYKLGRGVPQDLAQAADWFGRAARQNHLQAADNLGLVLYDMGQKGDALPWLQQSADRGEPRAQFVLAAELYNGERMSRDLPRAYALMKRSADAGLQRAAAALVQMDSAIPMEQRRQGLALAEAMEVSEGQARLAAMTAGAPPRRPAPPATVRTADVPPSAAGTSYAPPPVDPAPPVTGQPTRMAGMPPSGPAPAATGNDGLLPGLSATRGSGVAPAPATAPTRATRPAAPAATARSGAWRIQLGAFSTRARAEALWRNVTGLILGATPDYVAAGNVTRLQAGPYASRAEAERACAAVRPAPCFPVSR